MVSAVMDMYALRNTYAVMRKSLAARVSWKRVVRHNLGFKMPRGWGWVSNPRKALYNRVYNRTSISLVALLKKLF